MKDTAKSRGNGCAIFHKNKRSALFEQRAAEFRQEVGHRTERPQPPRLQGQCGAHRSARNLRHVRWWSTPTSIGIRSSCSLKRFWSVHAMQRYSGNASHCLWRFQQPAPSGCALARRAGTRRGQPRWFVSPFEQRHGSPYLHCARRPPTHEVRGMLDYIFFTQDSHQLAHWPSSNFRNRERRMHPTRKITGARGHTVHQS